MDVLRAVNPLSPGKVISLAPRKLQGNTLVRVVIPACSLKHCNPFNRNSVETKLVRSTNLKRSVRINKFIKVAAADCRLVRSVLQPLCNLSSPCLAVDNLLVYSPFE